MSESAAPREAPATPRSLWIEGLSLYAITTLAISAAAIMQRGGVFSGGTLSTITTIVLIYVPLAWIFWRKLDLRPLGVTLERAGYGLKIFALFTLATLPVFYVGNHFWETLVLKHHFRFAMPDGFWTIVVGEILAVALPEEFFYRGYLQSRLEEGSTPRFKALGVRFGWGFLTASVLFALAHTLVTPAWWHVGIVLPALAFGWLRLKTGSILAPVLFHAACNLTMVVAQSCYQ